MSRQSRTTIPVFDYLPEAERLEGNALDAASFSTALRAIDDERFSHEDLLQKVARQTGAGMAASPALCE